MCKMCGQPADKSVRKPVALRAQDIHSSAVFGANKAVVGITHCTSRKLYGHTPQALCTHKEFALSPIDRYLSTLSTPLITMTTIYI